MSWHCILHFKSYELVYISFSLALYKNSVTELLFISLNCKIYRAVKLWRTFCYIFYFWNFILFYYRICVKKASPLSVKLAMHHYIIIFDRSLLSQLTVNYRFTNNKIHGLSTEELSAGDWNLNSILTMKCRKKKVKCNI